MNTNDICKVINNIDSQVITNIVKRCFSGWKMMKNSQEQYYYTDINAILNGILKNDDKICLWASRWSHLNDPDEIKNGLKELEKHETPKNVIEATFQILKSSHSISFSGHKDFLPMWKMYGDGGFGAMLIFDTKLLIDKWRGILQPCIYKDTKQFDDAQKYLFNPELHPEFNQLYNSQKTIVWLNLIAMYASILKENNYCYEKETRIVGLGTLFFDEQREQKYRLSNGKIIPYVEVFMPKELLKGICLGPLVDSSNKEILEEFLHDKGYDKAVVSMSKIHYK